MKCAEFFSHMPTAFPAQGSLGAETDWMRCCGFELKGSRLWIGDLAFVPAEDAGVSAELPTGKYEIAVMGVAYGEDRRAARLRVASSDGKLGAKLGSFGTDWGVAGVCDIDRMDNLVERDEEGYLEWLGEFMGQDFATPGVALCEPADTKVVYSPSGFGDGTFTVFELRTDGQLVGLEVEFIEPETPYPFE
jgi:hypothetical protein